MKKLLLKSTLLLCALVVGGQSVWAATKTETFEGKAASTSYQGTVEVSTTESNCGIAWTIYYGCVSTNDKISDTKSAQMRWYSNATSNYPYAKTTTAIDGLSNVALKARTSDLNVKMDVCYSADGSSWTVGKTHTFIATGTGENVSLAIPSGNKYVKFEVSSSSTAPSSGNYKLIVDDVVFTYSSSLTTPTWSLNPTSATVEIGGSTNLQLTTNYDGTLSFESADTDIATVSYNSSTKVITINGIAAGSTTITATGAATSTYEAISKSIDVAVSHAELASNVTDVMSGFGYSYFGLTPSGSNTYAQPDVTSTDKTDTYGVTISWARAGSSNTKPRFDANCVRYYSGNTLTVTAPTGSYITKIVFTEPASGKGWDGTMTSVSAGEYVSSEKTWYADAEDIDEVVFTNDATKRIGGMKVYLNASSVPVSISAAGLATFAYDVALDFTSVENLEAYIAKENTSSIELTKVNKVPANTGVLLRATAEGTNFTVPVTTASTDDVTGNIFVRGTGAAVATGSGPYNWILSKKGDVYGFYHANGNTVAKNRAYLQTTTASARICLDFDDEDVTAIENVKAQEVDGHYFNLAGQRVDQPTKGLYIVNGKKVIVK